jgi:general transcription factor 3C polypeptide 1
MPLELFLQVIGSVKKIGDLAESCKHRVCLCDLPDEEFNSLMDMHATGRLSWLVDVIRRLKVNCHFFFHQANKVSHLHICQ